MAFSAGDGAGGVMGRAHEDVPGQALLAQVKEQVLAAAVARHRQRGPGHERTGGTEADAALDEAVARFVALQPPGENTMNPGPFATPMANAGAGSRAGKGLLVVVARSPWRVLRAARVLREVVDMRIDHRSLAHVQDVFFDEALWHAHNRLQDYAWSESKDYARGIHDALGVLRGLMRRVHVPPRLPGHDDEVRNGRFDGGRVCGWQSSYREGDARVHRWVCYCFPSGAHLTGTECRTRPGAPPVPDLGVPA